jgi:hypothetical protein
MFVTFAFWFIITFFYFRFVKSTTNAMKASIRVSICGLKSKLPYINSFVENAKSEEKKYLTHIQKTQTEMRTAAANIKDVLCKSVDMILDSYRCLHGIGCTFEWLCFVA